MTKVIASVNVASVTKVVASVTKVVASVTKVVAKCDKSCTVLTYFINHVPIVNIDCVFRRKILPVCNIHERPSMFHYHHPYPLLSFKISNSSNI